MKHLSMRERFLDYIFYQIYPRSFYDSNGDGIGDLQGIIQKLDHLQDLGVNAVWLSPCYKSPNFDNGYDISNYRDIMDDFGTFADWLVLKKELNRRGMKLIMDFVANHTSTEHFWFQEARKSRDNPYHDYYIWAEKPLNSWQSTFGGSAWEYNEPTNEYYLHSFAIEQADLNWENPKVRKEMQEIIDFWVKLGVDGFRCDVLDHISKDFDNNKRYDGPHLHEYIRELFGRDGVNRLFIVGECQAGEESICALCGQERKELTTIFQFDHVRQHGDDKFLPFAFDLNLFRDTLVKWQYFTAKNDLLYTLFTDNHDQPFLLSLIQPPENLRYECATMLAGLVYLLKGIPFIYQGQEFGSENSYFDDIEDFNDIETLNYYRANQDKLSQKSLMERVNFGSRDNPRRPMAWTAHKADNFGFSTGKPWLAMPTNAEKINLIRDKNAEKSVFRFYQKLLTLRKESGAIRYGEFCDLTGNDGAFIYTRKQMGETVLVVCNFEKAQTLSLPIQGGKLVLCNYATREKDAYNPTFAPFEIAVYRK